MNTLTAVALATTFAVGLMSTTVTANELKAQIRAEAAQHITELSQVNRQQAHLALLKTAIELQAWQSAEQYAAELLQAKQAHIAAAE